MRFSRLLLTIVVLLGASAPTSAQNEEPIPFFNRLDARSAVKNALASVHKAKCGETNCSRATTEEFVRPPLETDHARIALIGGAQSARLKWCGLDWQKRTFPALMQEFQQRGIHNGRILAMLKIIHDHQFGKDYANLQVLKTCSDERRAALDEQYPIVQLPPWQGILNNALLDRSVENMMQRVLDTIHKSRCGDGQCEPTTAEEKANPPVSLEQARQAMKVGLMAGMAQFCELDWQKRIFYPFIAFHRHQTEMAPRQLSIMATLHATMQGFMRETYKKHEKNCGDKLRQNLERQLSSG